MHIENEKGEVVLQAQLHSAPGIELDNKFENLIRLLISGKPIEFL
jgi:hypothetical protein